LERYIDQFARELKKAHRCFVTPVFAAWTSRGKVDSQELARRIGPTAKALEGSWEEMAAEILARRETRELVAVIGAGDLREIIAPLLKPFAR
jgi:UDP-N-acetylmuramate-alanine ligase